MDVPLITLHSVGYGSPLTRSVRLPEITSGRGDEEIRGKRRGGKEGKGKSGARARWIEGMRPREKVDKGERMRMRYDRGYEVERG